ncbi:MAG: hypothetical protein HY429_01785 [Candidatus Levybacteria bacterium]|nr:hypothetical protein [Candidatus Levybacteria bacterium]
MKTLVLLEKPARREVNVCIDYVGFTLKGSPWVEGYGLDSAELGRGRPDIIQVILPRHKVWDLVFFS